jgi:glucose-6-phosphate isomerase
MTAFKLDGFAANASTSTATAPADESHRVGLDLTLAFNAPHDPHGFSRDDLFALAPEVLAAHTALKNGQGDCLDRGVPMLGWQNLPVELTPAYLDDITAKAKALADSVDAYVSLGIGGSYLGLDASLQFLTHRLANQLPRTQRGGRGGTPQFYFLGQNLDPDYFRDTLDALEGQRVAIHVISKSGTTTETAVAFRILRRLLEQSAGTAAKDLTFVTTDAEKGALRKLAGDKGYTRFVVPDNIGGRFSVLSDVGLVGLAVAGIDLHAFVAGFRAMRERALSNDFATNPALLHAAVRTLAWRRGKKVEVVATNAQSLMGVARWMEQLFPESEGQYGRGLWVSTSMYSEKLHANGQMVQDGERNLLETFLVLENAANRVPVPNDPDDLDGLNFLTKAGGDMNALNGLVVEGPAWAHYEGGVPVMKVLVPARTPYVLGQLYYLFERSVAVSGYLLGHNPFVQPGVEAYKKAMFALAGKPGFEAAGETLRAKLHALPPFVVR